MSAPFAQTLALPCGEDALRPDSTPPAAFTGFVVGPFFCHHVYSDNEGTVMGSEMETQIGDWQVTHTASGACVIRGLRTAFRAMWLAGQLSQFPGCHETTIKLVGERTADVRDQIKALRDDARWGHCHGFCNFNFLQGGAA